MTKPSELPINTVIYVHNHGDTERFIRDTNDGWLSIDTDANWIYADEMDSRVTLPFSGYETLAIPVDVPALIKSTALTTVDAMLEVYKPGSVITRESLKGYRDELERSDFTDEAVKYG